MNETNRMFGTNSSHVSNQTNVAFQDRALTAADQTLLGQIRQTRAPPPPPPLSAASAIGSLVASRAFPGSTNGIGDVMCGDNHPDQPTSRDTTTQVPGVVRWSIG